MDQELLEMIKDLAAEFPCCHGVDPMKMNYNQASAHKFLIYLGWKNSQFNLKEAVVNWSDKDYKVFLGLLDDYRETVISGKMA